VIFNRQDVLSQRNPFRSGVINFDGEWIIPPRFQIIRVVGSEIFSCYYPDTQISTLYTRDGQKISDKDYDMVEDVNDKILHNRITVGYLLNKEEYLAAYLSVYGSGDLVEGYKRRHELVEAKYLIGFINSLGEEVIPPSYHYAEPFQHIYTTVTGMDDSGTVYSSVIDLDGNTLLKTNYERLLINRNDTTLLSAKKSGRYGIINIKGDMVIEAEYNTISVSDVPGIFIATDSFATYILTPKQKVSLPVGRYELKKLTSLFFYIKISHKNNKTGRFEEDFHVFGTDGTYYGDISSHLTDMHGSHISTYLFNTGLPEGYVAITPGRNLQPYVISIRSLKAFRKE
jgi:hypothetical protein